MQWRDDTTLWACGLWLLHAPERRRCWLHGERLSPFSPLASCGPRRPT